MTRVANNAIANTKLELNLLVNLAPISIMVNFIVLCRSAQ